ncbi:MAG: DUF1015 family protein [Candidatus Lokiarchaeota archaeon]|nr:DUF1015 family protein [Candidatus Lokiarchaeota archaeon]MBD3200892.1 DUF1015 family protein [Candidatus Lokiarchaeota archaeon]
MPEIITFRNFHYKDGKENSERLAKLTAPPYDVISKEEELDLKNMDTDNICHVILPKSYKDAGKKLDEMINNKTLICGDDRCFCIYGITFKKPDSDETITRYGFVGLLKLVEIFPASDGVIPHESTFQKYTKDRLNLIKQTDANFSPIFTIYDGNGSAESVLKKYTNNKPILQSTDKDGFIHKIWEIWKEEDVNAIKEIIEKNSIIIADGHHRYVTSLRHSRNGGCKYIMSLFIDFNDPGLIIYTSHRQVEQLSINNINDLLAKLDQYFKITRTENLEETKALMEHNKDKHAFGCYFQDNYIYFKLRENLDPAKLINGSHSNEWKRLDIPILHNIVFKELLKLDDEVISFMKDVNKGIKNVKDNKIDALFLVNPTTLSQIQEVTNLGEIMPQKSTYFFPKPLSGLIIHKHTNEIE